MFSYSWLTKIILSIQTLFNVIYKFTERKVILQVLWRKSRNYQWYFLCVATSVCNSGQDLRILSSRKVTRGIPKYLLCGREGYFFSSGIKMSSHFNFDKQLISFLLYRKHFFNVSLGCNCYVCFAYYLVYELYHFIVPRI